MACTYTYNGKVQSYDQLVSALLKSAKLSSTDVVYSTTETKQDKFVKEFTYLKERNKFILNNIELDLSTGGDPVGEKKKNSMHVLSFLDDDRFRSAEGDYYLPQMSKEDFIKNRASMLKETQGDAITEEQALAQAIAEFPRWEQQRYDAFFIHYILRHKGSDISTADIVKALEKLKTETPELKDRIDAVIGNQEILDGLKAVHDKIVISRPKGSKVITDVPVLKTIHTEAGDITLFDSINEVVIDAEGNIHIYKYKVSEDSPINWNNRNLEKSPKVEKYRFELAFIKAILEDSGFINNRDRNKVFTHIYAVQTKYDHEKFNETGELNLVGINTTPSDLQMDVFDSKSLMDRHISIARQFVQPSLKMEDSAEAIQKANKHMNRVWVGKNILAEALSKSAEEWIEQHKDKSIFKLSNVQGAAYKLLYPGHKAIFIQEDSPIETNKELFEKVTELLNETLEHNDTVVSSLLTAITLAITNGYLDPTKLKGLRSSANNISEILQPYFRKEKKEDGTMGELEWEYLKNSDLADYNILLFKHKKSGQVDIVTLTNLNLDTKVQFSMGRTSLAGSYLSDIEAKQLPASWGNVYAMKTMILLNYILPNLTGNIKLGNIKVLTSHGNGSARSYNIANMVLKYYNPLMQIVYNNTLSEGELENNFTTATFVDPFETLLNEFKNIVRNNSLKDIENLAERVDALEHATGDSVKIEQLIQLSKAIIEQYGWAGKTDAELANDSQHYTVQLLHKISGVINKLRGTEVSLPVKIGSLLRFSMPTTGIPSNNFKVVQRLWKETSLAINNEAYQVGLEINAALKEFYKAAGYSYAQNKYIGNQTTLFNNLYEENQEGKNLMIFKNPYDNTNNLRDYERKFLKKALMLFAKYRYLNAGKLFNYTDPDSPLLQEFIKKNESWYFNTPLKKASTASKLLSGYMGASFAESIDKMIHEPKLWAREVLDDLALKEYFAEHKAETDVCRLSVTNYFSYGETDINGENFDSGNRDSLLAQHEDTRYFETNVENLLRDFSFEAIRVLNMKKMVIASKLFLLLMQLSGQADKNEDAFTSELKYIKDFLKVNVFNVPLMEGSELAMAGFLLPARRTVSKMFIAGNVAGMMRDTFEGFGLIMARAVTKYGTDISASNVAKAYTLVAKDMMTNINTASIVSLLCIKYRMSNIDVSNVAEGMKTGNKGIFNFQDEMYKTLRTPDFLNRMVLFVAKAMQDGTWNAFGLDKDGLLTYDWKKDSRFTLLAANDDKSNPELYNKQKSLFLSLIRLWNLEHPENQIEDYKTLPMPYSESEMSAFHELSDNIWGSYDKANKALGEHSLIMMTFGMFTTWMNGQIKNYFKPMLESVDQIHWELARDNNNQLLFFNDDGSITTEDTGKPVMVQVPIMVQGIFLTLQQMYNVIKDGGSLKDEVFNSQVNRDNMKKLLTDMTMTLIYLALIKAVLQALRDKLKEITDPHDVITNGICEVLYKGMYNSWDGFMGPLSLISYLGESTNPPIYTESIAVTKDLFKFVAGDMTIMSFGSRHLAPIRSFRETIKAAETGKQS